VILDVNVYTHPRPFRPGNRYEVTVYGCCHDEVVCRKSIEFRTGDGL